MISPSYVKSMVQEARVSGTVVGMQQMELPISTFPNAFSRGGIRNFSLMRARLIPSLRHENKSEP